MSFGEACGNFYVRGTDEYLLQAMRALYRYPIYHALWSRQQKSNSQLCSKYLQNDPSPRMFPLRQACNCTFLANREVIVSHIKIEYEKRGYESLPKVK